MKESVTIMRNSMTWCPEQIARIVVGAEALRTEARELPILRQRHRLMGLKGRRQTQTACPDAQ
jgi:hypothetical protein